MNEKVGFTYFSWNPCIGCSKISEGCKHCYAESIALMHQEQGTKGYEHGFNVNMLEERLEKPYHWRKPREVFVNSMSDVFHEEITDDFVERTWESMNDNQRHRFYVLTKRPMRMVSLSAKLKWTHNIWCGVSVENKNTMWRMYELRRVPCIRKFVSVEPLLEDLGEIDLHGIDWVLCGGESGRGSRPLKAEWVRNVRDQCVDQGIPFYFKQWGGENKSITGRALDGRIWDESPLVPSEEEIEEFNRSNQK
jgi:protein gp37